MITETGWTRVLTQRFLERYGKLLEGVRIQTTPTIVRKGGFAKVVRYDTIPEINGHYYMLEEEAVPGKEVPLLPFEVFWIAVEDLDRLFPEEKPVVTNAARYSAYGVKYCLTRYGKELVGSLVTTKANAVRKGGDAVIVEYVEHADGPFYLVVEGDDLRRLPLYPHELVWFRGQNENTRMSISADELAKLLREISKGPGYTNNWVKLEESGNE